MGQLYDIRLKIEKTCADRNLDPVDTKGKISLRSGIVFSFVNANTPDDPVKLEKLKKAVKEVLNIDA